MLSAERQEFGGRKKRGDGQVYAAGVGERHCIQGPVGKRKEEGGAVQKIFKKNILEKRKRFLPLQPRKWEKRKGKKTGGARPRGIR